MATVSMKVAAAVVGGLVALGGAFALGKHFVDSPSKQKAQLVEFKDRKAGWAISYPKGWNRLESKDNDVALVVSQKPASANSGGSILARNLTLGAAVDDSNLAAAKEVTDKIVTSGQGIQLLAQTAVIHQGGLPGYFYFYSFKDPGTGQEGVHTHYFLFKGSTMISFVFQALPKDSFQGLAHLYDDVIGSFKVL
jgi:hypothetical protein